MRRCALLLLMLLSSAGAALAHGGEAHGAELPVALGRWTFDPWVVGPLLAAALLYGSGTAQLWRRVGRGRGIRPWQAVAYGAGWLALAGALVTPLHWLGEHLFTVHMIEHEIIMAVAAPLLALARPIGGCLWASPPSARRLFARWAHGRVLRTAWAWLTRPHVATLLHGAVLWLWHAPALLDATITDIALHRAQHLSFLLSALLFWWALLRRATPGVAAGHLFVTMLHMSVLGALIALAPRVLYPVQTAEALHWGLTPLEDQQLAGLTMWVPAGTIYAGAALLFVGRWISRSAWSHDHALRQP